MKKYTIRIVNDDNNETLTAIEFSRRRFTAREFKMVTEELFFFACQGIEFKRIYADVFEGTINELKTIYADVHRYNDQHLFTIYCNTKVDGAYITASIIANEECIRRMAIAE